MCKCACLSYVRQQLHHIFIASIEGAAAMRAVVQDVERSRERVENEESKESWRGSRGRVKLLFQLVELDGRQYRGSRVGGRSHSNASRETRE